ncbi:anhydro-N-acetylmuramic acid kinase [Actinoallomurus bryophytorum]|uniref:Anhydro-N-acetylmuramic acid kinase n=1 Tax=Actinoallomurus bryophytorum TaxID=1490222 RepID=A0A543C110_9ACTN|nr:anhydro-N-acetylmuramic acid kinase [Actinoallomurus bryophytorum]TQL90706.1 anhydro-N-acetylmuramic acid kinase [Actinoallomurus bryophytorum]
MRVLGLVSGTSFDAIEVAAADLAAEGEELTLRPLGSLSVPYAPALARAIAAALPPAATTAEAICSLDTRIGQAFAEAAARGAGELAGGRADLVVSHGQTLYHQVADGRVLGTLQIGRPAWIAERTGLPVVADLRARDVAAGGQGAPLVSLFDTLLLRGGTPRAALNLGGIANITVLARGREPVAFDTGPANALLDAVVAEATGGERRYDAGGAGAAAGTVHDGLLDVLLAEPYYAAPPPKTTGKELFGLGHVRSALAALRGDPPSGADLLATLTRLTATTVARAIAAYEVDEVIASGGGTANPSLMADLAAELRREAGARLRSIEEFGIPSGAKEAYAFTVLGWLTAHGLPGTVASCTGASGPRVLGVVVPGADGKLPSPSAAAVPPRRLRIAPVRTDPRHAGPRRPS